MTRATVGQQVGDFVFVSFQLRVSLPHIGRFIRRVLQLDDRQRQAIDEDSDIGPASLLGSRDAELVNDQQIVVATHEDLLKESCDVVA